MDKDIPYVYDDLLRRFVRDHNSPGKWVAEGNHQAAIAKWRNLTPSYHEDQLGLCAFYTEVEVGFAIAELEIRGFLSAAEASCVVLALFDGARQCKGGKMTGIFLRGFYTALREGRASTGDSNTVFYRRLRLTKLLEKRAGIKRAMRTRNTVYENLNEEREQGGCRTASKHAMWRRTAKAGVELPSPLLPVEVTGSTRWGRK